MWMMVLSMKTIDEGAGLWGKMLNPLLYELTEVPKSAEYMKINGQGRNNTFENCQHISRWYLNHETENN